MKLFIALLVLLCLTAIACSAGAIIDGGTLTVSTPQVRAVFKGGDLVSLTNTGLKKQYCLQSASSQPMLGIGMVGPMDKVLRSNGWQRSGTSDTAITTFTDGTRAITMMVSSLPSGEIAVKVSGSSKTPGVTGITWGVDGLDMSKGNLVLPAYGGAWAGKGNCPSSLYVDYPTNWEAQLAIWQGQAGGFLVYSVDRQAYMKKLHLTRDGDRLSLGFETEAIAPWPSATETPEIEWRIRSYKGDWRAAAAHYRTVMRTLCRPVDAGLARAWAKEIKAVVTVHGQAPDLSILTSLQKRLIPKKTMLYLPSWRKDEYDANYPNYTPGEGARSFIKRAKEMGFRVMLHTDLPGVTTTNPAWEKVKQFQLKEPQNLRPMGWFWDKPETVPQRFAFVNPAAKAFRDLFIECLRPAIEELAPDAIHLDVSGAFWNDGNGLIEGRTYVQGSVQLHRELLKAFPQVTWGGESINEVLAPYEWFAQRWIPNFLPPHPISAFLFSDHVTSYGYLGQPAPDTSAYIDYVKRYERQGVVPTLAVYGPWELSPEHTGLERWFRTARAWQQHDLTPDWTGDWRNVLFRYKGRDGSAAVIQKLGSKIRCVLEGQSLYERISGANSISTRRFVRGWPAYNDRNIYGLDPEKEYWLDEGPPPEEGLYLSYISGDAILAASNVTPRFGLFELNPLVREENKLLSLFPYAKSGTIFGGQDKPLEWGATASLQETSVGGVSRRAIFQHPPWMSGEPGKAFLEYRIRVPDAPRPALELSYGLSDGATGSDGVTFSIAAHGKELWKAHSAERSWQNASVDLSSFRGKSVALRLITDPGPKNDTGWDHACWSDLRILSVGAEQKTRVHVSLPGKRVEFAGPVKPTAVRDHTASFADLTLPCTIIGFTEPGSEVKLPQDLLDLPFDGAISANGIASPAHSSGIGGIGHASCGGVAKVRSINAHPPDKGQTIVSWLVALPADQPAVLSLEAGIVDGSFGNGVDFSVRVNNEHQWSAQVKQSSWQAGCVDLSQWRGQTILLQFITDPMGEHFYDWARWADMVIKAAD